MEAAESLHSTAISRHGLGLRANIRTASQRTQVLPSKLPERATKISRRKWTTPRSGQLAGKDTKDTTTPNPASKVSHLASTSGRRLVPLTERISQEDREAARGKRETGTQKCDIAPDGGSAGREGRQFTVANVGNNGRIYLRPTVRPAHQRYPQPNFTFPVTPPSTSGPEGFVPPQQVDDEDGGRFASQFTSTTRSPSPVAVERRHFPDALKLSRLTRHRRAMSDSTVHETNAAKEPISPDNIRVVIGSSGDAARPRTMEDLNPSNMPLLNINIPSWRIGTPRFTLRGTPVIRGSSYAPTEENRSSSISAFSPPRREPHPTLRELALKKSNNLSVQHAQLLESIRPDYPRLSSPCLLPPLRSTYMPSRLVIEPAMFNELTFKPHCDDRSIVRYASTTGAVTAATPPRLVAEITSPTFLDYELISDFFLTFRSFLEPMNLLRMLVARLRWSLARNDEIGMVVRVRAFVALRHWILNYFMDDYVLEYDLRVTFCNLVNGVVDDVLDAIRAGNVQVKILVELKKCWRRVCAQYWDGPDFVDSVAADIAIAPGGIAGSRDPSLDPTYWDRHGLKPPQPNGPCLLAKSSVEAPSMYVDLHGPTHIGDFVVLGGNRPVTPENHATYTGEPDKASPLSYHSIASLDVVSCPFPLKAKKNLSPNPSHFLALHTVPTDSSNTQSGPVATTPKALMGKRVRPTQSHKRNNSLTDSLREHSSDKSSTNEKDDVAVAPEAGSLVRGNLLPPTQAFVDVESRAHWRGGQRQTTIFKSKDHSLFKRRAQAGAMSGYGMKKLLGSVRRAISSRGQAGSTAQGSFLNISPVGPRGVTANRLPGTAVVPQERHNQNGVRPPVRIDLLGAEVAEDFKMAIREEEEEGEGEDVEAVCPDQALGLGMQTPYSAPLVRGPVDYSAAHMDSSTFDSLPQNHQSRPFSDTAMTTGSKSIVIVDGTVPFDGAIAHEAFVNNNQSADTFEDNFLPKGGDPTPPNTPPGPSIGGTPRRSSYLLNQHVVQAPASHDTLPPFIPDLATLGGHGSLVSEDHIPLSIVAARHNMRLAPLSGGTFRMHRRHRSSRSQQSHIRRASFSSGVLPYPPARSFDATTESEASVLSDQFDVPVPEPLRVLRRRPGGDLKAATNIGDLNKPALRRSLSVGSFTTYTDSIQSSYLLGTQHEPDTDRNNEVDDSAPPRTEVFSVGQLANKPHKRDLSLYSTHSSKPIMRPSFEVEAQRLAQIPDEDDGGVESALSKLEGRFEKKPEISPADLGDVEETTSTEAAKDKRRENYLLSSRVQEDPEQPRDKRAALISALPQVIRKESLHPPVSDVQSFLSEASLESYSSIPILQRETTETTNSRGWTDRSVLTESDDDDATPHAGNGGATPENGNGQHLSFDFIQKTDSMERIQPGETAPVASEDQSFLDDESLDGSDISSELSDDEAEPADMDTNNQSLGEDMQANTSGDMITPSGLDPLSPPITLTQALHMSPEELCLTSGQGGFLLPKPMPPTPETSPKCLEDVGNAPGIHQPGPRANAANLRKFSVHLPFILAFESDILAQQFTLIEKDALNEVDWKELIDMNWKNPKSKDSRSWVEFLRNTDAHGVEVVIARFNIMVKWAISEIVLTQHVEERARCIIKFIHIAAHCRRYRNFSTLAQLTIALSSNEIARLTKTWELVPLNDITTLSELELLVTPMRNFYNIREEMEAGTDEGCIPFVGIYTHDLLYNAQRPSEIAGSPTSTPLVNFERCRVGAAVVKTLLRLLEASTRYTFQPIEGVIERCLWMGALSDDEIRRHSESLE